MFEPALCDVYAKLFSHVIARALPEYSANDLLLRYRRIRQVRRFQGGEVRRVFVLSRVTLGADVAVTSVALSGRERASSRCGNMFGRSGKKRGDVCRRSKNHAYYGSLRALQLLRERLLAAAELQVTVDGPGSIVIDPDSRLTQLGLIPVCDDARYFFFESRAAGGELDVSLSGLTAAWLAEVFDVEPPRPYVAPLTEEKIAGYHRELGRW